MTDHLKPLSAGDPFPFSQKTWNPVLEKTRQVETITQGPGRLPIRNPQIFRFRNDSGVQLNRYDVIETTGSLADPSTEEEIFDAGDPVLIGNQISSLTSPVSIVWRPAASDKPGVAIAAGMAQCRINISDTDHRYALPIIGDTVKLQSSRFGIPLVTVPTSIGIQRHVIRVGEFHHSPVLILDLTQVDGSAGGAGAQASWTYDVVDALTGETLATDVDPTSSPHEHTRPAEGALMAATVGIGLIEFDQTFVIKRVFEFPDPGEC